MRKTQYQNSRGIRATIRAGRRAVYALAVCAVFHSLLFAADDGLLSVDLSPNMPKPRANAPIQLMFVAHWNGSSILRGRFRVRHVADGLSEASETLSQEVVMPATGRLDVRITIPSSVNVNYSQDEIFLEFLPKDGKKIDLGMYPLNGTGRSKATNLCLVGPTDLPLANEELVVLESLRLDDMLTSVDKSLSVSTTTTRWGNADVPRLALHFCSFDVVLLSRLGLGNLRKEQMDPLLQWVRAGGSVCCVVSEDLGAKHVDFLNQLVAETGEQPFALDSSGSFAIAEDFLTEGVRRSYTELGRTMIVQLENLPDDARSRWDATLDAGAFLWRLRGRFKRNLTKLRDRKLNPNTGRGKQTYSNPRTNRVGNSAQVSWQSEGTVGQLVQKLMPDDVKVVPMGMMGLVLIGYLLLVGPGEYFILGWLRRRRWTWITFPVSTILVSLLCIAVSNHYLSSDSTGKTIAVRDIGADGRVLRESRFVMHFLPRRQKQTFSVKSEIFSAMDHRRLAMDYNNFIPNRRANDEVAPKLDFVGRMPDSYEVTQQFGQWTPKLNRFFSIAPDQLASKFDWSDKSLIRDQDKLRRLASQTWPNATVMVLESGNMQLLQGNRFFSEPTYDYDPNSMAMYNRGIYGNSNPGLGGSFLSSLCARRSQGFFRFVSQVAPTGGDTFEDLALISTEESNQAVLIVAEENGEELLIQRRLYSSLNN